MNTAALMLHGIQISDCCTRLARSALSSPRSYSHRRAVRQPRYERRDGVLLQSVQTSSSAVLLAPQPRKSKTELSALHFQTICGGLHWRVVRDCKGMKHKVLFHSSSLALAGLWDCNCFIFLGSVSCRPHMFLKPTRFCTNQVNPEFLLCLVWAEQTSAELYREH